MQPDRAHLGVVPRPQAQAPGVLPLPDVLDARHRLPAQEGQQPVGGERAGHGQVDDDGVGQGSAHSCHHAPVTDPSTPPTRWELTVVGDKWDWYVNRFNRQVAEGNDLEGEARFLDMMADRGSTILDGGCGTGRVAAALHRMGHRVVGLDRDAGLIEIARRRYPGPPFLVGDLLAAPQALAAAGQPTGFDLVALPGNVMVYLAPGTERDVLAVLGGLLRPGGRLVTGFATDRDYTVTALATDAEAVGLAVEHRFATWHLDPWTPAADWAVTVLRRPA